MSIQRKPSEFFAVFAFALLSFLLTVVFFLTKDSRSHSSTFSLLWNSADSARSCPIDTIRVNLDNVYNLHRKGLSYYHVAMIVSYREQGYFFTSIEDLQQLKYFNTYDTTKIAFSFDTTSYHKRFQPFYHTSRAFDHHLSSPSRSHSRIPFFLLDSTKVNVALIDTLRYFQNNYILRGSISPDSLAQLSSEEFVNVLNDNVLYEKHSVTQHTDTLIVVELNSATLEDLTSLKYVGQTTAEAILDYRDKLGGYLSLSQLKEVWAVDDKYFDKLIQQFTIDTSLVRHININSRNDTRLRRHPYFGNSVANTLSRKARSERHNYKLTPADLRNALSQVGKDTADIVFRYVAY